VIAPERIGDWTVIRILASGGFASVMEVEHHQTRRRAALKLLHLHHAGLEELTLRFLREATILTTIRHPSIVQAIELGIAPDQRPFVVMELLSGRDLEQYAREHGAFSVEEVLELLGPVCDAVGAAHGAGIVHRDVKLSNVFLAEEDGRRRVVLLDFGVAKLQHTLDATLSTSRHRIGTPMSMAPEQIIGGAIDARTDVYALAAMTYELLTGRPPFSGTDPSCVQFQQVHAPRPRPSAIVEIDPGIDHVITRAMSIAPQDRYASAREFFDALRAVCSPNAAATGAKATIGAHISVRIAPTADGDGAAREIERRLRTLKDGLTAFGFAPAFEGSSELLMVRPLSETPGDEVRTRRSLVTIVEELAHGLRDASPLFSTQIVVHRAGARCEHGVWSGELVEMDWVPDLELEGAFYTRAALIGLAGNFVDVDVDARLLRVASEPQIESERLAQIEAMAALGRKLAMFIHELRTPLTSAYVNLDCVLAKIRGGQPFEPDDVRSLAEALEGVERSSELIAGLLELSRFGANVRVRERVRVRDLVASAVKLTAPQIRDNVSVAVAHEGDAWIEGSPGRLSQVLVNVLVNAAQTISGDGQIEVQTRLDRGRVQIVIRETRSGIAPELRSQIFEPFVTARPTGIGTGLGLHIVQEIVREHDGTITIDAASDARRCVIIELPSARSSEYRILPSSARHDVTARFRRPRETRPHA
jgi:signal transduction histidine kinase